MRDSTSQRLARYRAVRSRSEALCAPLAIEDHVPQPLPEASPPKWHLAHTAWFFETFVLGPRLAGYRVFDARFAQLFNSYYESQGERVAREARGLLSRPTVAEVLAYRAHVDTAMEALLAGELDAELALLVELGLQHEQQHQELLVTDIKVVLAANPLAPAYGGGPLTLATEHQGQARTEPRWLSWPGGLAELGHAGAGFAFDNEAPRHAVLLAPVQLRDRLVSNAEYQDFIADGGYRRFEHWHAEGWDWVRRLPLAAPLYWRPDLDRPGQWQHYTLAGWQVLPPEAPISHISYYEAHAFCHWAGWRLPTEFEWEALAPELAWGQRWEWTASAYQPYPGFRPAPGAVGEYNGKFMVNQQVLRGASWATPPGHARSSYRNFFAAAQRWQYTGLRPARDIEGVR